ncbi:hypothetical protein M427DRAFT_28923 [Gonapodya prolifera JEL478]|uniref:Uncharacterized protein n=1 Tax=Gonapodya prolifera (strain JEL478) TaxID=1344416 RepID=A0A139ARU3_GONPJ|nr:hypothetical protein M427DRAFT_28923 [Gonapodya prolifera JEL478]|eukprot:KXS19468.1 hypothetical protein M427DRAFT_28923 [Gonapodya prolifera JEL478]
MVDWVYVWWLLAGSRIAHQANAKAEGKFTKDAHDVDMATHNGHAKRRLCNKSILQKLQGPAVDISVLLRLQSLEDLASIFRALAAPPLRRDWDAATASPATKAAKRSSVGDAVAIAASSAGVRPEEGA